MDSTPYTGRGTLGRPSDALPDNLIRERLTAHRFSDGTRLQPHHVEALEPHVRLAIDFAAAQAEPSPDGVRSWRTSPEAVSAGVDEALSSARYLSSRAPIVKRFTEWRLVEVSHDIVAPLVEALVLWRGGHVAYPFAAAEAMAAAGVLLVGDERHAA